MNIYWENWNANIITLKEESEWHLYCDFDQYEEAHIYLEVNGKIHDLSWSNEYTQGREHLGLDPYHIIEFYSAVVREVFNRMKNDNPEFIDLTEIKNATMPPYWKQWRELGKVEENDDQW